MELRQYVASCSYLHPVLGDIKIRRNASAQRIVARWHGTNLCITIPAMTPPAMLNEFLEKFRDRLLAAKPSPCYSMGQVIDCAEVDFSIVQSTVPSDTIDVFSNGVIEHPQRGKHINYYIKLSAPAVPVMHRAVVQQAIYTQLMGCASHATRRFVLPFAERVAAEFDCRPKGWSVKESRTKLGSCSNRGNIVLSPRLIFLPEDLRRYVVCHELAHLTHLDHSPAFHELCNRYCRGAERQLEARLRAFQFPIP